MRLTADLQRSRRRLVAAREEERRRLRRDLHDGLGAQLAGLTVQTGVLRGLIPRDPEAAEALAGELRGELRTAIADIRRLVHGLRPPALDELGLTGALQRLAESVAAGELRIGVEVPDDLPPLPAAVEVAAYRVVQEALTNVVRHADAHAACVRLALDPDALTVEVTDDGSGGGGRSSGTSTTIRSSPAATLSARRCRAPVRPSSSSAGGRSPWTRRRMSAIAVRNSVRSSPARASAASGIPGDQAAQHAGLHGQPGQLRAEAVVQVRRSLRRSSSRAATSRSRDRCRSAVSRTLRQQPRPGGRGRQAAAGRRGERRSPRAAHRARVRRRGCRDAAAAGSRWPASARRRRPDAARPRPATPRRGAQRLPHRGHDGGERGCGRERRLESLAELCQRGVRLGPPSVHQAVHPSLQPVARGRDSTATGPWGASEISRSSSRRSAAPR